MKIRLIAPAIALALLAAGCSSGDDTVADPSTPTTTSAAPTTEAPEPEATTSEDAKPASDDSTITPAGELYEIYAAFTGGTPADVVAEHGGDKTMLAVARNAHPLETLEVPDAEILALAQDVCARYDDGRSPDQAYEDIVANEFDGDATGAEDLIYTFLLTAPDTHCTQHVAMRDEWLAPTDH